MPGSKPNLSIFNILSQVETLSGDSLMEEMQPVDLEEEF